MKRIACAVLLGSLIALGAGCVELDGAEAEAEAEAALASAAPEGQEAAGPASQLACSSKSMRVSVPGGTAYLATNTCSGTRTGNVVNECTGSTVYWRVRSASSGATINSGTKGNCVGGGVGTFYQQIKLEVKNAYGYWEGLTSY
jgi:hypothetical protein